MIDLIAESGLGSFLLDAAIWLIVIVAIVGGALWYWFNKMWYKYLFIEIDRKGNFRTRKAKIIRNANKIKKFVIKEYNSPEYYLSVKQYNGTYNGKPCRFVTWDGMGNIVYCDGFNVDDKNYLSTCLLEVERTEAVDGSMEAAEKSNVLTSVQKWTLTSVVILGVMVCITLMFVAKMGFEQIDTVAQAGQLYKSAGDNFKEASLINRQNTVILVNLAKHFNVSLEQEFGER